MSEHPPWDTSTSTPSGFIGSKSSVSSPFGVTPLPLSGKETPTSLARIHHIPSQLKAVRFRCFSHGLNVLGEVDINALCSPILTNLKLFHKAFTLVGIGVGMGLWLIFNEPLMFCAGFFICMGIGAVLDEIKYWRVCKLK